MTTFDVTRFLGWADGMRILADALGSDYEPPKRIPGESDPITKFLANKMREQNSW